MLWQDFLLLTMMQRKPSNAKQVPTNRRQNRRHALQPLSDIMFPTTKALRCSLAIPAHINQKLEKHFVCKLLLELS
jgi:hypothetical protein